MIKSTKKNIAKLFDRTPKTIGVYSRGSDGDKRLFKAMRDYFEKMEQSGELSKIKGFENG